MSIIEILSVTTGIISVYLTIKQNILCWIFGLISCTLLSIYFNKIHFYGQMTLQIVSIFQCIYGWLNWNKINTKEIKKIGYNKSIFFISLSIILGLIFTQFTQTNINIWSYMDGVGGFIALLATFLLVIKKIESWWIFMINNISLSILCIHQGAYFILFLNILYFIMSINGYKEWKRNLKVV